LGRWTFEACRLDGPYGDDRQIDGRARRRGRTNDYTEDPCRGVGQRPADCGPWCRLEWTDTLGDKG
jgi:hypothetical protein